jgi:hypothetical protein
MLSDPIHHLLVIFHGNIDEYFHGLGPGSLPYAIASGFLTKWPHCFSLSSIHIFAAASVLNSGIGIVITM